jgi:hypothetical protein
LAARRGDGATARTTWPTWSSPNYTPPGETLDQVATVGAGVGLLLSASSADLQKAVAIRQSNPDDGSLAELGGSMEKVDPRC